MNGILDFAIAASKKSLLELAEEAVDAAGTEAEALFLPRRQQQQQQAQAQAHFQQQPPRQAQEGENQPTTTAPVTRSDSLLLLAEGQLNAYSALRFLPEETAKGAYHSIPPVVFYSAQFIN